MSRLESHITEQEAWLMCVPRASQVPSHQEQQGRAYARKTETLHVMHRGQAPR